MLSCSRFTAGMPSYIATIAVVALMIATLVPLNLRADDNGKIQGQVIDKATGEALIGVTVMLKGTAMGAQTDLDGNFRIKNVPPGTYILMASSVNYETIEITGVVVAAGDSKVYNFSMQEEATEVEGITVTAKRVENTEATVMKNRQKAVVVSDAISAQEISRSGSGDAAEAMTKVTGASVVGGKYVYVRGLGDRYASTQLNGSALPSPDPDKQAVPMDLIPSGLLDNIVVEKTFTPDKPGNFAGGSINLTTKDYPDHRSLTFSSGIGYNSKSTFNDIIGQTRSDAEWLGYDGGQRDVPSIIADNPEFVDRAGSGGGTTTLPLIDPDNPNADSLAFIEWFDAANKSFSKEMVPVEHSAPLDHSFSLAYGDAIQLFDRPVGISASLSYSRKFREFQNGERGEYKYYASDTLEPNYAFGERRSSEEVLWGTMAKVAYSLHSNHKLTLEYVQNQNGEQKTSQMIGTYPEIITDFSTVRTFSLTYAERKLSSLQFSGDHQLLSKLRFNWQGSLSSTNLHEPDRRFLTDVVESDGSFHQFRNATDPVRQWRDLQEDKREYKADFILNLTNESKLKWGGYYSKSDRENSEFKYQYTIPTIPGIQYSSFDGDIEAWLESYGFYKVLEQNVNGDTMLSYSFPNQLYKLVQASQQYTGEQEIVAGYGMFELPIFSRLKMIAGARIESSDMWVETELPQRGEISEVDVLPSVNVVSPLTESMNLRAAYTKTLARPTFREMSPARVEEFAVARIFNGNPDLERTLIDNLDLRWEWFIRPGEVAAVSTFYKRFKNPIEQTLLGSNGDVTPVNVPSATVYGLEIEFRRRLDHVHRILSNFKVGGNLTLVHSSVDIADVERTLDNEREMAGQSPYVINFDIGYDNFNSGTQVSLFFNRFGRRFAVNNVGRDPDVYEAARSDIDLLATQRLFGSRGPKLKFAVKNLTNADVEFVYDDPDNSLEQEYYYEKYSPGVNYSLGISYDIW